MRVQTLIPDLLAFIDSMLLQLESVAAQSLMEKFQGVLKINIFFQERRGSSTTG